MSMLELVVAAIVMTGLVELVTVVLVFVVRNVRIKG
jgi:hypothetical protein